MSDVMKHLEEATKFVRVSAPRAKPRLGIVLGSGWGAFAETMKDSIVVPYSKIPHFSPPSVVGHKGQLRLGQIEGVEVAVFQGRIHFYEGHDLNHVVLPIRLLKQLGASTVLLTNAAGGIAPKMKAGDFMVIKDHLNLTGSNVLIGPNVESLGTRFPDMTYAYNPELRRLLSAILKKQKVRFSEGIYCGLTGPTYETPSEIRYIRKTGAHAVGMSTVQECIAAVHCGLSVAGLSCITNLGAGMTKHPLSHSEVTEIAKKVEGHFTRFLKAFIAEGAKKNLF